MRVDQKFHLDFATGNHKESATGLPVDSRESKFLSDAQEMLDKFKSCRNVLDSAPQTSSPSVASWLMRKFTTTQEDPGLVALRTSTGVSFKDTISREPGGLQKKTWFIGYATDNRVTQANPQEINRLDRGNHLKEGPLNQGLVVDSFEASSGANSSSTLSAQRSMTVLTEGLDANVNLPPVKDQYPRFARRQDIRLSERELRIDWATNTVHYVVEDRTSSFKAGLPSQESAYSRKLDQLAEAEQEAAFQKALRENDLQPDTTREQFHQWQAREWEKQEFIDYGAGRGSAPGYGAFGS